MIISLLLVFLTPTVRGIDLSTTLHLERYTLIPNSSNTVRYEVGNLSLSGIFQPLTVETMNTWGTPLSVFVPISGKPIIDVSLYNFHKSAGNVPTWVRSTGTFAINFQTYVIVSVVGGPLPDPNPLPIKPSITAHPKDAMVVAGSPLTLRVAATGTAPFQYQWQKNFANIPGATGSSYTISNPQQSSFYAATVSNLGGTTYSDLATVWVESFESFTNVPRIYWQTPNRQIVIWFVEGTQVYVHGILRGGYKLPEGWRALGVGDMDKDGKDDIVFQHADGRLALWAMDGLTFLHGVPLRRPNTGWRAVGLGHFNDDANLDILFRRPDGRVHAWYMNGTEFLSGESLNGGKPVASTWRFAGTADFNDDSKSDLLWQNTASVPAMWLMDGTAISSAATLRAGAPVSAWRAIGAADFNGDGNADILWRRTDHRLALWHMNGSEFLSSTTLRDGKPVAEGWKIIGIVRR
ncbi:MAG: VCBS repeat-containing protein [Verrucomicrobia bacterium]|nr:VCBS repeat-containing protein [Verrucomicrobiota bacterium]